MLEKQGSHGEGGGGGGGGGRLPLSMLPAQKNWWKLFMVKPVINSSYAVFVYSFNYCFYINL